MTQTHEAASSTHALIFRRFFIMLFTGFLLPDQEMTAADTINRQRPRSVDEAFEFCARITNAHYENFPVASLFLPEEKRPYIQAIYAFSRTADDFADELDRPPEARLELLDDWEAKLRRCFEGDADHPVFVALQETRQNLDLPIEPFIDLLKAFKQDVTQRRYDSFDDLLEYCRCSANPVGRLVLMIFGYRREDLLKLSDHICTALQLTNFWQDVAVDCGKDRLYVPLNELQRFGYSEEKWKNHVSDTALRELMKYQVERTRELFYRGAPLPALVERDLRLELKLVWFGGMAILKKLERNRYNVFNRRPTLNALDKLMVLLRGLFIHRLSAFGKKEDAWPQT